MLLGAKFDTVLYDNYTRLCGFSQCKSDRRRQPGTIGGY
jgi:hypothetical protein